VYEFRGDLIGAPSSPPASWMLVSAAGEVARFAASKPGGISSRFGAGVTARGAIARS
jgi:hypothetical protein